MSISNVPARTIGRDTSCDPRPTNKTHPPGLVTYVIVGQRIVSYWLKIKHKDEWLLWRYIIAKVL